VTVSIVKFDGSLESIGRAIELSAGFDKLAKNDRVLIKPNITFGGWVEIPPYGMLTTSKMVEGILWKLAEHGCNNITIGEGTILGALGSNTMRGFKQTGIDRVAKRYGAKLIDINDGPFDYKDLGGIKVGISKAALEADFLINVPVLKTHAQVKVSLGFKNLKGCLEVSSRKAFHMKGLQHLICLLNQSLQSGLTIIDGIYMLEKGPDTMMGVARRKNLIIASRDAFACDCVGATILGFEPSQIDYLREYAQLNNRPLDVSAFQIVGERLEPLKEKLMWEVNSGEELFEFAGITGLSVPHPGLHLCSGCYANLAYSLGVFGKINPNLNLGDTTIYSGRNGVSQVTGQRIILYGNCAIQSNNKTNHNASLAGCPPQTMSTLLFVMRALLSKPRMFKTILLGSPKLLALRAGVYSGNLPKWRLYRLPEFDRSHFREPRLQGISRVLSKWRK
jgi:uncharacterized protein (DUF362 family)